MSSIGALNLRNPVRRSTLIGLNFPLTNLVGITEKRKQFLTCIQKKPQKQRLSDYAQQDLYE
jgi:hypothetical protein